MIDLSQVLVVDSPLEHGIRNAPAGGYFVEFGVATGATLRLLASARSSLGFDTFAGLPEPWRPGFDQGLFAQDQIPIIPGATIVVGLFQDTLPKVNVKVALAHIDCDLYSSTKVALDWVKSHAVPGCVVVFDEFFGYPGCEEHEQKALAESGLKYEILCKSVDQNEKVAIRLKC